jgi:hypothetical protein
MMHIVEDVARRRFNHERARAFGLPVLRSLHPDALLVGYSIVGFQRAREPVIDRMVEANHVVRSSLDTSRPLSFTTRTWKFGDDLETSALLHAVDHLRNNDPEAAAAPDSKAYRDEVLRSIRDADRRAIDVRIDGTIRSGHRVDLHGSTFVTLRGVEGAAMISIAAPPEFISVDFSSEIPE